MATLVVTSPNDAAVNTQQSIGTLRQAIFDANDQPDADTIQFAANLSAINLTEIGDSATGSALVVSSPITIQGNATGITIQRGAGAPEMRLFFVTAAGNLTLESLTLAGGLARGASGIDGRGGAAFNQGTLTVMASTLYNNVASGGNAVGGGNGGSGLGGAIYNDDGSVTIKNATLSGNSVEAGTGETNGFGFGGGVYSRNGSLSIFNSTITNNAASTGRGVYLIGDGATATAEIQSSIIGSADVPLAFDFLASFDAGGTVQVSGVNNLIRRQNDFEAITFSSEDPLLATLGPNGGPTQTHALAANSPAVNHGVNPLNLTTDQRGASFARASNDIADIGAFERQSVGGPALPGDYNGNSVVDAADYIVWRKSLDTSVEQYSGADGNGDGQINSGDYDVWRANFGRVLVVTAIADDGVVQIIAVVALPADELPSSPVPTLAAVSAREVALVDAIATRLPRRAMTPAMPRPFLNARSHDLLELALSDVRCATVQLPRLTTGDLPHVNKAPADTSEARAIDELLADWPTTISRGVSI